MTKGRKQIPDTLAVIDNYKFCDTHTGIHTDEHGDSMANPAQRADSVKLEPMFFGFFFIAKQIHTILSTFHGSCLHAAQAVTDLRTAELHKK